MDEDDGVEPASSLSRRKNARNMFIPATIDINNYSVTTYHITNIDNPLKPLPLNSHGFFDKLLRLQRSVLNVRQFFFTFLSEIEFYMLAMLC